MFVSSNNFVKIPLFEIQNFRRVTLSIYTFVEKIHGIVIVDRQSTHGSILCLFIATKVTKSWK